MKISYEWLKRFINVTVSPEVVAEHITGLGLEVESVTTLGVAANPLLVVGEILERAQHPNADKLSVCKVDAGTGSVLQIVCGAPNCDAGNRVPVALVGCKLPGDFTIKAAKLRGVESQGMLCATDEIGLGGAHEGLMILSERPAIGTPLHQIVPSDTIFEINVLANRPDALSHVGIARDLAAKWGVSVNKHETHPPFAASGAPASLSAVAVENAEDCPHYRAYVIKGIKIAQSPAWLQGLLKSIGMRPISNVVDITNFILHSYGQPLHAFDLKKIEGGQLKVRRAATGEKLTTLDGQKRDLEPSMLVIADAVKPLVIAGVMGGQNAEVDGTTTDIVLEAAQFNPTLIRKTARKLALFSDSSHRYERGIDPLGLETAAQRAVALILELAGGQLEGAPVVAGHAPYTPRILQISREFIAARLGFNVDCETIEKALTGFGFEICPTGESSWSVKVPSYRLDVERANDLVEEVLRFIGVDRIPAAQPMFAANEAASDGLYNLTETLSQKLVSLGYNECMHYTQRSKAELERLTSVEEAKLNALDNPLSAELSHQRFSLIPGLVEAVALNRSRGNTPRALFEVGHVFRASQGKLHEFVSVAFVQVVAPQPDSWKKPAAADFFTAKATAEALLAASGVGSRNDWTRLDASALWQPYHAAQRADVFVGKVQATAGIVAMDTLKAAGLTGTLIGGELLFALDCVATDAAPKRYAPFSAFQNTRRDLALIVPQATSAGSVQAQIKKLALEVIANRFQLESLNVFDQYQGQGVPEGMKSLAFALTVRSMEGTLTDEVVNGFLTTLIEKLKAAGLTLRS